MTLDCITILDYYRLPKSYVVNRFNLRQEKQEIKKSLTIKHVCSLHNIYFLRCIKLAFFIASCVHFVLYPPEPADFKGGLM